MGSLSAVIDAVVPVLNVLLLGAVGLDLSIGDFARVRRRPSVVLTGLAVPLLTLPLIAALLAWLFRPSPEAAGALLLIAACPIGGISNTYTYLARASTALSVTLTGLSCLLAGITMPVVGRFFAALFPDATFVAPLSARFVLTTFLMLTLPILVGMAGRARWPDWSRRMQPGLQRCSFAGVALLLVLIVLDNPAAFVADVTTFVPLAAAFVACSSATGWVIAPMVTADARDRFTLAAEFATRNLGVALVVAVTLLHRVEFARFALAYFLTEIPLMLVAIGWFRRREAALALQQR